MPQHGRSIDSESESLILDRLAGLTKVISPEVIEQALSDSDRVGQRRCQLSHRTMLWIVLTMGLLTHLPLRQVFKYARRMTLGGKTPALSSLCGQKCVVKENVFECAVCGRELPAVWNCDS
ncbi:transposase domain-containing protein [Fimbriiglobus ruber]|uniref:Transposase IS4 N-terminal domain-containing protein n=1 Tax=Fimbriiglobus ruber TaxID=1908690 RepID=A0A225DFK8_9BACT|nr:transposase domain-containing protein [Fimbriiglobus ruber]OWK36136.1 hypothetical protein FRUB_08699 [Fimbriiglobus ruber]